MKTRRIFLLVAQSTGKARGCVCVCECEADLCSGQMIAGPPRKKVNMEDMASDLFEAAKK